MTRSQLPHPPMPRGRPSMPDSIALPVHAMILTEQELCVLARHHQESGNAAETHKQRQDADFHARRRMVMLDKLGWKAVLANLL